MSCLQEKVTETKVEEEESPVPSPLPKVEMLPPETADKRFAMFFHIDVYSRVCVSISISLLTLQLDVLRQKCCQGSFVMVHGSPNLESTFTRSEIFSYSDLCLLETCKISINASDAPSILQTHFFVPNTQRVRHEVMYPQLVTVNGL